MEDHQILILVFVTLAQFFTVFFHLVKKCVRYRNKKVKMKYQRYSTTIVVTSINSEMLLAIN